MNKICTSIKQSKKLVELGIDANRSDCSWILSPHDGHYILSLTAPLDDDIPAWSLTALLELLDYPQLSKDKLGSGKVGWMVSVYPNDCRYDSCWHDNPVDACYEMIIKLNELKML